MAYFVMLVAEEYERRINKSRKNGGEKSEEIVLFSSVCPRLYRSFYKNLGNRRWSYHWPYSSGLWLWRSLKPRLFLQPLMASSLLNCIVVYMSNDMGSLFEDLI